MKPLALLAVLVAAFATAGPAAARGFTTHQLSDPRVGWTKQELQAQHDHSLHVLAFFTRGPHKWMPFPHHATCWSLGRRAARVCNQARLQVRAHRWLHDLAQARYDRLYRPKPVSATVHASAGSSSVGGVWAALAGCESGGNWAYSPFNHGDRPYSGFDGGLQFSPGTWSSHAGGTGYTHAYDAPASVQVAVAERVLAAQGWGAWPVCSRVVGAR